VTETTGAIMSPRRSARARPLQLAEILEIDMSEIGESSSFADDLNADSLALIELVEALEEELGDKLPGFRIDDEDLEDLRTVRDAVDYVSGKSQRPEQFPSEPRSDSERLRRALLDFPVGEDLLHQALSHRSYCSEWGGRASNERLELLGDAVLGLVVADHLYRSYPELPEGDLARLRSAVVSTEALAPVADELGVGEAVLLGRGEEISGGRSKTPSSRLPRSDHRRHLPDSRAARGDDVRRPAARGADRGHCGRGQARRPEEPAAGAGRPARSQPALVPSERHRA